MDRELDLDTLTLQAGGHDADSGEMCVMEAVAFIAGEPWTERPQCASPVIAAFLRSWNDGLQDYDRQTLKQWIPRLVGSRGTVAQEERRAWMVLDWLIRAQAPAWLRLAGLTAQADLLAGLATVDAESCSAIQPVLDAVRVDTTAARAAARAAAWDAARDAAGAAAWAAARDAAWAAARDAARDAARTALEPTKVELQAAAHDLVDRMLAVTEQEVA